MSFAIIVGRKVIKRNSHSEAPEGGSMKVIMVIDGSSLWGPRGPVISYFVQ